MSVKKYLTIGGMRRLLKKHKKGVRKLLIGIFSVGVIGMGIMLLWISTFTIPTLDSFEERKVAQSTKIYDRTGEILLYDVHENIRRTVIPFDEISRHIKNATIAIEDTEFYNHKGVRPLATFRAVFIQPLRGRGVQGGSTITQQVVKNALLTQEKTITRKIKEWVLALRLETIMDKDRILHIYLNESPYGGSMYGVEEASMSFFGKRAKDVTIAEAAYLAALPQAPTYYSPYGRNKAALDVRKNLVLNRMRDTGFITAEEHESARGEEVEFRTQTHGGIRAPHFVMYVREYLANKYGEETLQYGGLTVITSLDYSLQEKAEEIVKKHALENEKRFNAENASLVAIDPRDGQILVMVGSRDYFDEEIDGNFNIATANRQPGSTFKPFAYASAFNKGYTPETILFDVQTEFSTACSPQGTPLSGDAVCYRPVNYDGIYRGPVSMRDALAQSINIPAIKALYLAGMSDTLRLAKDMGITSLADIGRYGLTLVLGGGEVSLLDLTSAYGVFAHEGIRHPYAAIIEVRDPSGILEKFEEQPSRALSEDTALKISSILSDNAARTPAFGAQSLMFFPGRDVAVKTGTTNDYRDAWIVGYTPNIVAGAWAGNNNNSEMEKRVAGFIITPLWSEFMKVALETRPNETFRAAPQEPDWLSLKPVLRGIWTGSTQIETEYQPERNDGDEVDIDEENLIAPEIVYGGIHSILFWVDKDNPRGPIPTNPERDSQFLLWEYGVQNWLLSTGALFTAGQ